MNKHQKLVQKQFLNDEEAVIKRLKTVYKKSLDDITDKLSSLDTSISALQKAHDSVTDDDIGALAAAFLKGKQNITPQEAKETLQSMIQSKVYQKNYQAALKKQVGGIYDMMLWEEFKTVSSYLTECYENGFIGTMFDLQGQGIPMCFPLDQESMVRAVQLDSKISKGLYTRLGEDVAQLKKKITAQVSRGISTGMSYQQVAQQLAGVSNIGFNNAVRIARTEGHRIQVQSSMDACYKAQEKGADVVKQWDSTLDSSTRESHVMCDGEIRELDKPFSNGLMFPGDPGGAAAEVINCRCALLQRAKWALDDDELQTLKDRAAYFGIDKTDSFEEFKAKYLDALKPAPVPTPPPKKEYLTKKKLEEKISEGHTQIGDLDTQFKAETMGYSYDDIVDAFGSLDDFATGDKLKKLKSLKTQMDDVQKQIDDYQEKLNKKIVAAETKKLKKEQILLQDKVDAYDIKTYSGIWKDDVTTADWAKLNIEGKKKYYEGKFITESDPDKLKEFQTLYNQLKELDDEGKKYYDLQQSLNKVSADLTKLKKNGIISQSGADAFTQDRKDAAYWFTNSNGSTKAADGVLRDKCGEVWKNASADERYAIYDYTCGSGKFNRPLSGFEKPYSEYGTGWEQKWNKGVGKVWIDYEGAGDEIRRTTDIISRSTYDFDIWLQRGCDGNAMESFFNIAPDTFSRMSNAELQQFVGRENRIYSFVSTAVSKGNGFDYKPVTLNIYAPQGTQMMYAEPFSNFGHGDGLNWDGVNKQSYFGGEAEMLVQRGASYTVTKIEKSGGQIYIDLELHPEKGYDLFQQDPSEWKGSTKKGR